MNDLAGKWWGDFTLPLGETMLWEVGPLQVAVKRLPGEWLIAHETIAQPDEEYRTAFGLTAREPAGGGYQALARYVTHETPEQITVRPALADRPVVSRPYTPFAVPPGEMAAIYVSTPLWFGLLAGEPAQPLHEIPIQRPSDTWFGPSPIEGEACYASRTLGRLDLQNVAIYAHRALTQVQINNRASTPLLVERLNLPVPYLSLFVAEDRVLWTEAVTMVQERETSLAEFSIENKPPDVAQGITFVAPPRKQPHRGMLVRAFGALKITDL